MLYHLLGGALVLYLGTLFLLNLIPHVTVKHLGWFSINHIHIDLGKTTMYIKLVRLSLNWVRGKDSILKLFRLEIHDVNFTCRKPKQDTKQKVAHVDVAGDGSKAPSCGSFLKFSLPKSIFERVMKYKLTNKVNVHVYRCSLYHRATHELLSVYIDYGHLEVSLSQRGIARAAITMVSGQIQDAEHNRDEVKIFRNIEFEVTSDLVMSCPFDRPTKVDVILNNFKSSFSISQLYLPIERLLEEKRSKKEENDKSSTNVVAKPPLTSLEPQIALLVKLFPMFTSFNFTLEDFSFFYYEVEFTASNFVINAARESIDDKPDKLDITAFLTSFKVLHLQNKGVDLPSATFKSLTDPVLLIKAFDAVLFEKENTEDYIDWETSLNLTNPTLHIYYDQIDILLNRQTKTEEVPPPKSEPKIITTKFDYTQILERLRHLTVRLVILSFKLDVVLPPIGGNPENFNRLSKDNLVVSHSILSLINTYSTKNFGKATKRKKFKLNTLFRLKSFRSTFMENVSHISKMTFLCAYNIKEATLLVRVNCKIIKIHSVNQAIFYLVRRIRNNENERYNRKYEQLKKSTQLDKLQDANGQIEAKQNNHRIAATNELNLNSEKLDLSEEIKQTEIGDTDEEFNGSTEVREPAFSAEEQQVLNSYINLFEILPSFVYQVQVKISAIETDILCKDGLPSYIVKDDQGNDVDLADFKRGICVRIISPNLIYKKAKEELYCSTKSVTLYTVSDCFQEYIEDFDEVSNYRQKQLDQSDLSSLDTTFSDISTESTEDGDASETKKIKKVFNVHDISIGNRCKDSAHKDVNSLVVLIPDIDARMDMFFFWCIFYAHTLLHYFEPTVKKACSKEVMSKLDMRPKKNLKMDFQINSIATVLRLPNNVDVMLEVDSLQLLKCFTNRSVTIKYIRLYVIHPATKLWARLLVISEPSVLLNLAPEISDSTFEIVSTSVRLNIPHQFLFYTVIDNILTLAKALKQIGHNFKNLSAEIDDYSKIMPEEKPPVLLPSISVKTKTFGITLENDPLETQLQYIYQVGLIEQQQRMKLEKAFAEKEKEILESADPDIEDKIELTDAKPPPSSKNSFTEIRKELRPHHSHMPYGNHTSNSTKKLFSKHSGDNFSSKLFKEQSKQGEAIPNTYLVPKRLTFRQATEKIRHARDRLHREFSTSWIRKVRLYNAAKYKECHVKSQSVWGVDEIQPLISEKFDILNYSSGPPALGGCFKNLDLLIHKTEIPDLDKFLHDLGGGQPQLVYTILVPIFLRLRASSLYIIIKDYPLPFISFPDNLDPKNPTIDLLGNFVVHEMLVSTKEEMRYIFVPFSPAAPSGNYADNFYSTYVPRTLTPVKFTGDMSCNLTTPRACMINWNKSYQSALLVAMAAFDNFSKPEVDDSPIGWWDKLALIAHGTIKFNVKNELCFHLKSSMSPYDVTGRAAGFVFAWKNNVCLSVNSTGDSRNLVRVESDDFKLGIPNYSVLEHNSWSLSAARAIKDEDDISEDDSRKYLKTVVQLSSDEKVVWIFGMMFERNVDTNSTRLCDREERTDQFKNHWDIKITNPCFDTHEDSYPGYRSDYIHMSLTVIAESKNGKASNAAYFTPFTFQYFFYWWNTLSDGVSMPVKQGKLFKAGSPKKQSLIKTGPHLMTMKYLLIFEPLTIAHTYMHGSEEKLNGQSRVLFTGLKGKFKRITIDLHQRKELVTYINERLGIHNQILHLKMNAGEVNVDDADIRFVRAIYSTPSLRGWLVRTMTRMIDKKVAQDEEDESEFDWNNNTNAFDDWIDNVNEFDEDLSWVDLDDFVELEIAEKLLPNPKVIVIPFCYTPKFSYYRDFSLHKEGPYPFGREKIALYDVSTISPDEAQAHLLAERVKTVKNELKQSKLLLKNMEENATEYPKIDVQRVQKEIKLKQARLDTVESMWEDFSGTSSLSASSLFSGNVASSRPGSVAGVNKPTSRTLSIYSSHATSIEQDEANRIDPDSVTFHNRFIVHNIQIKWDNSLRSNFITYMQNISDRKSHVYFMSKKAVELVESVVNSGLGEEEPKENLRDEIFTKDARNGEEIIKDFHKEISMLEKEKEEDVVNQYLIKLIHPQIQLVSEKDVESCVLVTSRDLEVKIVNVTTKGLNQIISESSQVSGTIESRYGVLFGDSHIFVFKKDESTIAHPQIQYGTGYFNSDVNWPPWVEPEVCYDSSWAQNQLVAERNTMALIYKKPNYLYAEKRSIPQGNEIVVHLAKIVINTSSEQYTTLYNVVTNLLVHNKTHRDEVLNRLDKIVSLSDHTDFQGLDIKVKNLQELIRAYRSVLFRFERFVMNTSPQVKRDVARLKMEIEKRRFELDVIMRGLGLRSSKCKQHKQDARLWSICADQLIWHILDVKREPFIDFAMAGTNFRRVDSFDGSNNNQFDVSMIQGFNLQNDAVYPELLKPLLTDEVLEETGKGKAKACSEQPPIISMLWQMLEAIGGISIMQHAKLGVQPLKVGLDYNTAKQLFEFLFPKDDASEEYNDLLKKKIANELNLEEEELVAAASKLTKSNNPFKELLRKSVRSLGDSGTESDSFSSARRSATLSSKLSALDNSSFTRDGKSKSSKRSGLDKSSSTGGNSKSSSGMLSSTKSKSSNKSKEKVKESGDDISIIINRSSKYISIVNMEIELFSLNVSFKAPLRLKILNVHELNLQIPKLIYNDKMWSAEELTNRIKKDLIKIILNHSGKIIGNKLKRGKRRMVIEPLKQIQDYASFMTIQDLQTDGRSRDAAKTNSLDHAHPQPHLHGNGKHHGPEPQQSRLPRSTSEMLESYLEEVDEESLDENNLLVQLSGTTGLSEATETTVGQKVT